MVKRRQVDNEERKDFVHCIFCQVLILKVNLQKHVQMCKGVTERKLISRTMVQEGLVMPKIHLGEIGKELGEILKGLCNDPITYAMMNDSLILAYGQNLVNLQLERELYR